MQLLIEGRQRAVFHVAGGETEPAVYWLRDEESGGVLINTPAFDAGLAETLAGSVAVIFYPSGRGARDVAEWREALNAETVAGPEEPIDGPVDIRPGAKQRLSRNFLFRPMSGRTSGTCGLYGKRDPNVLFTGPALEPGADGWPTLVPHDDDYSWENRVFGALGLRDARFDYCLTDSLGAQVRIGPGADAAVAANLDAALGD
jgi:hypothetical protein